MPCGSSKDACNQDKNAANGHCAFEDLDHSVLQEPINLGVTNVKQILKCIQSGSKEIKDIVLNECNIIYECKACVGLFRSLANFMYHKRCYCKKHLCEDMLLFEKFDEEETITVLPEAPKSNPEVNHQQIASMADCTVELEKSDIAQEENFHASKNAKTAEASDSSKNKNVNLGNNKMKTKSTMESEKVKNPMISRRTRDKNAQTPTPSCTSKISVKSSTPEEPPLKCVKIISSKIVNKDSDDKSVSNLKDGQLSTANKEIKLKKLDVSKLAGSLEKNVQQFPKIIFKAIDSNPHAVYQSNEKKKLDTFGVNKKIEAAAVETKVDNDKLIIVLKKDTKTENSSDSKAVEPNKQKTESDKTGGFHLTRRNRLMVRSDCDVHELKCLVCKTQFMSLKTLYFHMLSLHSKKRLYYPCPFCKTLFVQMYGVTRHLISIHNKTKEQTNKLRDVIKKKSVWKKIDDVTPSTDKTFSTINYQIKADPPPEIKVESKPLDTENGESESLKTVIKLGKNVTLHQCSKCNRVFGRKSSQVSHQKFCIMNNAIKTEVPEPAAPPQPTSPVVSFLSLTPKTQIPCKPTNILHFDRSDASPFRLASADKQSSDVKMSIRPKRGAEKQMHKDFVNSQTLKWRSANRIETHANVAKTVSPGKKTNGKSLEKKVLSIMNAKNLTCLKCDKKFSSYSNLRRHVAIHVGWTRFKCKYCDYQAYNKSQCWSHVQKSHSVNETDMDKSIVNLVNSNLTSSGKKTSITPIFVSSPKRNTGTSVKSLSPKTNNAPKIKISKKKNLNYEKKQQAQKRDQPEAKKDMKKEFHEESVDRKNDSSPSINKKETIEVKKDKSQPIISFQKFAKKEVDNKKEKPQHIIPIQKLTMPDYKRDTNYKSVTTSNPTTIILSKKIPSSTVQSIVTISPESMSSTSKISPIRTSPRKNEIKGPGERLITTLVTRSSAYSKTTPIQIKLPSRSNSVEELSKDSITKSSSKKERLISEWFPKKEITGSSIRRESAPLIIGLVPAVNAGLNSRDKNSSTADEKNDS